MGPPPLLLLLLAQAAAAATATATRHVFFIKAPTSPAAPPINFTWLQQSPTSFSADSFRNAMGSLHKGNATENLASSIRVGLTYQWEMLDCFLSPHTCTTSQTVEGITNFLNAAKETRTPVQITLDTVQFWYSSDLWNWFDATQPGYAQQNLHNVEWTGWTPANATTIAWRNWGSQFRMPTPQPNLASPQLLEKLSAVLITVIGAIREWHDAQTPDVRQLLVDIKLGEEVDVGANFYFYPSGNQLRTQDPSHDPKYGPKWTEGLSGGLPAQGYNLVRTLGLRTSGGPPTRDEITQGVQHYFAALVKACKAAWPGLGAGGLRADAVARSPTLSLHAGLVGDPLLIKWTAAMVGGAIPGYSAYPGVGDKIGQPGLATALQSYDPDGRRFVVAESTCFGCQNAQEWLSYFDSIFNNPYGSAQYVRIYNIQPFIAAGGALDALATLTNATRPANSCFSVDPCGGCWCPVKQGSAQSHFCCNEPCEAEKITCGCGCTCHSNCIPSTPGNTSAA